MLIPNPALAPRTVKQVLRLRGSDQEWCVNVCAVILLRVTEDTPAKLAGCMEESGFNFFLSFLVLLFHSRNNIYQSANSAGDYLLFLLEKEDL